MTRLTTALLTAGVLFLAGCGAETAEQPTASSTTLTPAPADTSPPTSPSPSPSPSPPAPTPAPEVSVEWFSVDEEAVLLRFVAAITNPGPQTLHGIQTEWVAYDDTGAIVGSHTGTRPAVGAGETFLYVGGAGGANLSGVPARVDVTIADPGRFMPGEVTRLSVSDVTVEREQYGPSDEYTVSARAEVGDTAVDSQRLRGSAVLRDESGTIVGADFWSPSSLPATLSPGSSFRIEMPFIAADAPPTSADVVIYVE